jgi:magnesium transporter
MRSNPRSVLIHAPGPEQWDLLFTDIDAEDLLELAESFPQVLFERAYTALDKLQKQYYNEAN